MDVRDFLDVTYAYAINTPESRNLSRSGLLGFMFEFSDAKKEEEMTHEGFVKQALDPGLLAELDAFNI